MNFRGHLKAETEAHEHLVALLRPFSPKLRTFGWQPLGFNPLILPRRIEARLISGSRIKTNSCVGGWNCCFLTEGRGCAFLRDRQTVMKSLKKYPPSLKVIPYLIP